MTINEFIDDIIDECRTAGIKTDFDRFDLLNWASAELNKISGEYDADCFYTYSEPIASLVVGTRNYDLPANFPMNFAKAAGDQGDKFCCMYDDATSETPLDYMTNTRFYSMNLSGESNGTPSKYTIISSPNGRKQISLSPPPDAANELNGLYKPTDWDLKTMDDVPSLPANSHLLKYAVLRRINPERWNQDYAKERSTLLMELASSRKVTFVPNFSGHRHSYTLMR
jgi:hypothetical protein